jgi:hypothetical protein
MKRQKLKLGMMVLAFVGLMLTSCQDEGITIDSNASEEVDLKAAETQAEVDNASEEVSTIIEEAYLAEEYPELTKAGTDRFLPDCVTVTIVLVQNMKTVTIDFGDGCELRNGNYVSGKIILEYERDSEAATRMISYSFEEFYFNRKNIDGGGSILRERSNENGNPQSTKTFDITVTWPDETFASKVGVKVREWIEGHGSGAWGDNVFLITGNGTFTKKDGTVLSAEVVEPLRRELSCKFLVSGIINLAKNEDTAVINYGDGACDDLATISINGGEEREIHLSNL